MILTKKFNMHIKTTGEIFKGNCSIKGANCKANSLGVVTKILLPKKENEEIHVCNVCLYNYIIDGIWHIKGAFIPLPKKD